MQENGKKGISRKLVGLTKLVKYKEIFTYVKCYSVMAIGWLCIVDSFSLWNRSSRYDNTRGPFTISSNLKSAFIAVYCTRLDGYRVAAAGKKRGRLFKDKKEASLKFSSAFSFVEIVRAIKRFSFN